jgi:hypothetical protein
MAKTPRDLADRMAVRRRQTKADDGYARETFTQPREQARQTARAGLVSIAMAINNKAHFIEHPPFAGYGSGLLFMGCQLPNSLASGWAWLSSSSIESPCCCKSAFHRSELAGFSISGL